MSCCKIWWWSLVSRNCIWFNLSTHHNEVWVVGMNLYVQTGRQEICILCPRGKKKSGFLCRTREKKNTQIYISVNYPYAFTLLSLKWFFNTCYCTKFYLLDSDYLMAEREGLLQLWYSLCLVNERDFSKIVFCVITFYIKLNDFSANT